MVEVDDRIDKVAVPDLTAPLYPGRDGCEEAPPNPKVVHSKRMLFAGDRDQFSLFVKEGLTADDVMRSLIGWYAETARFRAEI